PWCHGPARLPPWLAAGARRATVPHRPTNPASCPPSGYSHPTQFVAHVFHPYGPWRGSNLAVSENHLVAERATVPHMPPDTIATVPWTTHRCERYRGWPQDSVEGTSDNRHCVNFRPTPCTPVFPSNDAGSQNYPSSGGLCVGLCGLV